MCSHTDKPLTAAACTEGEGGGMQWDGDDNSKVGHGENITDNSYMCVSCIVCRCMCV